MGIGQIVSVGISVSEDGYGYYTVTSWSRTDGNPMAANTDYEHLTWSEVGDVVAAELDENRPGWVRGGGWRQAPLFP